MTIDVGIHHLAVDEYHADPTPEPSLSASGINRLLEQTPAHFKAHHPRLTEWPIEKKSTKRQELGTVIHALVLGEGAAYKVLDFKDYKTKDAQLARDFAYERGEVPIIREVYDNALSISASIVERLRERFKVWPLGESERALIWKRPTEYGEIWCRALADHLVVDVDRAAFILDLKTTSLCVSDFEIARKMASEGDDIQAAWYIEAVETLYPALAGKVTFIDVFAEVDPPYEVRVAPFPEGWRTMASRQIDRAANLFAKCLRDGEWPGYQSVASLQCPTWREQRWMDAELAEGTILE